MSYTRITYTINDHKKQLNDSSRAHPYLTYRISLKDVCCDHFTENALAANVPHLHRHLNVVGKFETAHKKVQPNRLLVTPCKLILTESTDQRSFPHCSVSKHHNLILEVFRFTVFFLFAAWLLGLQLLIIRLGLGLVDHDWWKFD